jgi:hypothetical protein
VFINEGGLVLGKGLLELHQTISLAFWQRFWFQQAVAVRSSFQIYLHIVLSSRIPIRSIILLEASLWSKYFLAILYCILLLWLDISKSMFCANFPHRSIRGNNLYEIKRYQPHLSGKRPIQYHKTNILSGWNQLAPTCKCIKSTYPTYNII